MDWIEKISDKEIKEKGVSALSNRPNLNNAYGAGGLTAKQLKEWFDQLATLIIEKQNDIIDKTDPAKYAPNLPMDISGEITTLADFIDALKNGTLADEGLMVEKGEEKVSLASFLGELVTKLSVIGSELSNGLAGKVDREPVTSGTWLYKETKDGSGVTKTSATNYVGQVATYGNEGSGTSDAGGHITTSMPKNPYHAAPREYVDTNTPAHIVASMNTIEGEGEEKKEYVLRLSLVNRKGDIIPDSETSIDLPLEMAFVGAALVKDEDGNEFVEFTLQNGEKLRVGLSAIFAGKVDKTTDAWKVYGTGANGVPYLFGISSSPITGFIPQYFTGGILKTNAPVEDDDTANKEFVETALANKVNVQFFETGKNRLYCARAGNPNGYYELDSKPWIDCIPVYTNVESNITPSTSVWGQATIVVVDPKKPYQAANMRYVDGKVGPIANDVAILFDALGGATEYSSVDSKDNPVTVPSNVFSEANIDKIGTGMIYHPISVFTEDTPPVLSGGAGTVEAQYRGDSVFFFHGESVDGPARPQFTLSSPLVIDPGETLYYSFVKRSGTVTNKEGQTVSLDVVLYPSGFQIGADQVLGSVTNNDASPITIESMTFNANYQMLDFNDASFYLAFGKQATVEGVPVTSVQINGETVYTIPEELRTLTVGLFDMERAYGVALSDTVYNYLDLETKTYVVHCYKGYDGVVEPKEDLIDVSAYLTDEDGEITVAAGDKILFVGEDGNSVGSTVPSTITYIVKKGAS